MLSRLTLTARLTVLYTLVSALVLLGLGTLVLLATGRHFVELDRVYLQDKIHLAQRVVTEAPQVAVLTERLDELLASHPGLFIQIQQNGQVTYAAHGIAFPEALVAYHAVADPMDWSDGTRQWRGMSLEMDAPPGFLRADNEGHRIRLLAALDTFHHTHFMVELRQRLALYVLLATLVSGVLGWWAARSGLAPLRIMKERAMTVTVHKLDQRMPVEAVPVEMADLAQSLNAMLERLQADFSRLLEFSSDLAHELRTPISNLLTQTQVSLTQPRDAHAYRDILASNAEEFQRLARMVSDMLFLAKTEHGLELPHREDIALADEVKALFDFYEALAEEKQIRLTTEGQARVVGDRLMVRRAISNLLSNAIRHSTAQARVHVSLSERDGHVVLCVENTGPTIGAQDLPRIFDRFYRVDKSRTHPESEGTGLGLSITRAIMEAHGGSAAVVCAAPTTQFFLSFPAAGARASTTLN